MTVDDLEKEAAESGRGPDRGKHNVVAVAAAGFASSCSLCTIDTEDMTEGDGEWNV